MTLGGRVELLLEHSLVHGRHRPLGSAIHAPVDLGGGAEAVLGHRAAHTTRDPLGAKGDLVLAGLLAPLFGAVRVAHRHADDRNRIVHPGYWRHARNPAAGANDHLAVDLLAQDAVGAAHVVASLGRDRGG